MSPGFGHDSAARAVAGHGVVGSAPRGSAPWFRRPQVRRPWGSAIRASALPGSALRGSTTRGSAPRGSAAPGFGTPGFGTARSCTARTSRIRSRSPTRSRSATRSPQPQPHGGPVPPHPLPQHPAPHTSPAPWTPPSPEAVDAASNSPAPLGQAGGRAARGHSAEPPRNTTPRVDGHREACPTPPPIVGTNPGPQRADAPADACSEPQPHRTAGPRIGAVPAHRTARSRRGTRGVELRPEHRTADDSHEARPQRLRATPPQTACEPGDCSHPHRRSRRREHSDAEYVRRISPAAATDSPARLQVGARARAAPGRARPLAHRRPTRGHAPSMFHVKPPLHVKRPYRSTRGPGHAPEPTLTGATGSRPHSRHELTAGGRPDHHPVPAPPDPVIAAP